MRALRLDDVGAASKAHEIYTDASWGVGRFRVRGNWIPGLKNLQRFRKWGPYPEMTGAQWSEVLRLLERYGACLTVGVTACWVEYDGSLVPFPEKFPEEAEVLKQAVCDNLIEVANHGLTHCVLENQAFRPRIFSGNRTYHREFWDWISAATQREHLERSQEILQGWLGETVVTFVPPGSVFGEATVEAAASSGLRYISCNTRKGRHGDLWAVGTDAVKAFHDREIVLYGSDWLQRVLECESEGTEWVTVSALSSAQVDTQTETS